MYSNQINFQLKSIPQKVSLAIFTLCSFLLFSNFTTAQSKVIDVASFNEVVISPHIEVIFKEGNKESVSIEHITVPMDKLNILVKNNTLSMYLDGARIATETTKIETNGYTQKVPIYKETVVKAIVTYKKINSLDLRGEEKFEFESKISSNELRLKIYGESEVYFNKVDIKSLNVSIYGESYLEIAEGKIDTQKITAYGETKVNTSKVNTKETKITAYGDGSFQLNVSDKLKISSYGEATITYAGSPTLKKGIVIGESKIIKVSQ